MTAHALISRFWEPGAATGGTRPAFASSSGMFSTSLALDPRTSRTSRGVRWDKSLNSNGMARRRFETGGFLAAAFHTTWLNAAVERKLYWVWDCGRWGTPTTPTTNCCPCAGSAFRLSIWGSTTFWMCRSTPTPGLHCKRGVPGSMTSGTALTLEHLPSRLRGLYRGGLDSAAAARNRCTAASA